MLPKKSLIHQDSQKRYDSIDNEKKGLSKSQQNEKVNYATNPVSCRKARFLPVTMKMLYQPVLCVTMMGFVMATNAASSGSLVVQSDAHILNSARPSSSFSGKVRSLDGLNDTLASDFSPSMLVNETLGTEANSTLHDDAVHLDETEDDFFATEELSDDKPWKEVVLAALFINAATLVGLIFLVGSFASRKILEGRVSPVRRSRQWKFTHNIVPSFACGALLATTVFLITPESILMLQEFAGRHSSSDDGHHRLLEDMDHTGEEEVVHEDTDVPVAWRFGVCILSGYLLPILASLIFPHHHEPELCERCEEDLNKAKLTVALEPTEDLIAQGADVPSSAVSSPAAPVTTRATLENISEADPMTMASGCEDAGCDDGKHHCGCPEDQENHETRAEPTNIIPKDNGRGPPTSVTIINYQLASSVLLGDFFHNFTDGVLVGTAFTLCHRQLAIAVTAATVYHELAQELADYFLLTRHCHLKPVMALTLNFLGGLSVLLGGILILSVPVNSNVTGCILAIGGGVYIHIAASECGPRARAAQKNLFDKFVSMVSFVLGVVPIGLVLLNHGHCASDHDH